MRAAITATATQVPNIRYRGDDDTNRPTADSSSRSSPVTAHAPNIIGRGETGPLMKITSKGWPLLIGAAALKALGPGPHSTVDGRWPRPGQRDVIQR
jgi:hypothetical protein